MARPAFLVIPAKAGIQNCSFIFKIDRSFGLFRRGLSTEIKKKKYLSELCTVESQTLTHAIEFLAAVAEFVAG
jgi:hypothetical protein